MNGYLAGQRLLVYLNTFQLRGGRGGGLYAPQGVELVLKRIGPMAREKL